MGKTITLWNTPEAVSSHAPECETMAEVQVTNRFLNIATGPDQSPGPEACLISPPPSDILPTIGGGGTVKRHDKPRINSAAMRNASLVSTDLRFATLTDPSRRMARATMDAAGARKLQSLGGASLSTHAKHQKAADEAREKSQRREDEDDGMVEGPSNDGPGTENTRTVQTFSKRPSSIGLTTGIGSQSR
ncbi:hypothetical protein CCUS01_04804 [Colletotrichum cuscutae]|uniref:Uncharacterized protein n=1 Tax=Colletotrichum cuscutae TaxID=1209917 RepID=A0AAI9V9A8_9PEZI|nr:hypothetical protein CCUS01_04804 [Colletotrichum cuscutae]